VNRSQYFLALKEHQDVDSGSQVAWTQETEIAHDVAHALIHDPTGFLSLREHDAIAKTLSEKFGICRLRSIGGFSTIRRTFAWTTSQSQPQGGLQIRVDVTSFPFGEHYEIEVTNVQVPVSDVLAELEGVLTSLGVRFSEGKESKLDCFLRGCSTR
jgi:hypothetical protein